MKIFICSNENQMVAAKVAKYSILKRSSYNENDVRIINESDVMLLKNFYSKTYLRGGKFIKFDKNDMQSFTLLRFYIPELMNYQGKALVIDPDIFLINNGLELLEDFDFEKNSIYARKGIRKNTWGSSVLLLSCDKLEHWSLKVFIKKLHDGTLDYDELINLKSEKSVAVLDTKWNEFDEIKPDTILLHTTERLTQPWRSGLKLNSSVKPFFNLIPKKPIYKIFGKDLTTGKEHPKEEITKFFFSELSECLTSNIISFDEIDDAIKNKFIREDIKEVVMKYIN